MFPFEVTGIQQREAGTHNRDATLTLLPMNRSSTHHTVGRPPKSAAKSAEKPSIIFADQKPCKVNRLNSPILPLGSPLLIVLDTNVVLDALLFRDAVCTPLNSQLAAGELRWVASAAMRTELAQVLSRPVFDAWRDREAAVWERWAKWCHPLEPGPLTGAALRLRCTDLDDQIFIDLALACGARWLLSRDRAVLKLAKRARPLGLDILTPAVWAAQPVEPRRE